MRELRVDDLPDELLAGSAHVHVSSFFMHTGARDRLHERMSRSRQLGATVSLDTNDDPARTWAAGSAEAVAQIDLLFCNDVEAVGLAGLPRDVDPARVLHGSSGVPDAELRRAVAAGMVKINVGTALGVAFTRAVRDHLQRDTSSVDPRSYLGAARDAMAQIVRQLRSALDEDVDRGQPR